jgi:hypothetical protein
MYAMDVVLAANRDYLVGIVPFVIGLVVVLGLIAAVIIGMRLRDRGDMRSSESGPQGPDNPVEYERERRKSYDTERDGRRRLPHELSDTSGEHDETEPPRWNEGSSGGFGSGGPGHG